MNSIHRISQRKCTSKITEWSFVVVVSVIMVNITLAQNQVIKIDNAKPEIIEDAALSQRLEKDCKKRNPKMKNETVVWYELNNGFYGIYDHNNQSYMVLYGQNGNYIQTIIKTPWNKKIDPVIRSSFELSTYKMQEVVSYWKASGSGKKVYYIELKDAEGNVSRLWANEKGDFSNSMPQTKTQVY